MKRLTSAASRRRKMLKTIAWCGAAAALVAFLVVTLVFVGFLDRGKQLARDSGPVMVSWVGEYSDELGLARLFGLMAAAVVVSLAALIFFAVQSRTSRPWPQLYRVEE